MKKKILIILYIILILATLKLLYNKITNNILISKYENGEYSEKYAKDLTFLDFSQTYVADYNYGNVLYNNGYYERAIEQYQKALDGFVPRYKECNIRINYALAICKTVKIDEDDPDSVEKAIQKYQTAIDVLTEEECAHKNDSNGHNKKAQKLKEDIEKEIEKLKNSQQNEQQNNNNDDNENDDQDNQEGTKNPEEEQISNKIQDIKQSATQRQREIETYFKNYGSNYDYSKIQKNW